MYTHTYTALFLCVYDFRIFTGNRRASDGIGMWARIKIAICFLVSLFSYRLPWYQFALSCPFFFKHSLMTSIFPLYYTWTTTTTNETAATAATRQPSDKLLYSTAAAALFSSFGFTKIATWENVFNENVTKTSKTHNVGVKCIGREKWRKKKAQNHRRPQICMNP